MEPKVSVVIPVYNMEKYLRQCLDSVVNQSLRELEIICVDDGSTDSSLDILSEYAAKDERIRIIKNKTNMHAGLSRNEGLKYSRGEYILFLDSDDWLIDNSLEKLYCDTSALKADISRCRALEYDNLSGEKFKNEFTYLKNVPFFLFNRIINFKSAPRTLTKVNVAPWGGLYRREFLLQNQLMFDALICSNDRPFYCKTIIAAKRVVFFKTELINYRVNNSLSLVGNRAKNFKCHFESYQLIDKATSRLPRAMRKIYLSAEMFDMAHWLEKSAQTEYAETVIGDMKAFMSQLDTSPWRGNIQSEKWYKRINAVITS